MKKLFTYSIVAVLAAVLFTSCAKERIHNDRSFWLSQERGDVVFSSNSCGIYVVETSYGYTVVQNFDGLTIYEGDVMYGNFGRYGTSDFLNYNYDLITTGKVVEYDLSYDGASAAIDYYCPLGMSGGFKLKQSATSKSKVPRLAAPVDK